MKKLIIGGVKPAEAFDITSTLRMKAEWRTVDNAIVNKDIVYVEEAVYTSAAERHMVSCYPAHTVIKNGKEEVTLTLLIHVPGLSELPRFIEGYKECTLKEYEDKKFEPDEFTTVVLPERMRPGNDIVSMDKAWAATFELLYKGRSVISTATNLKENYLYNAIVNSGYPADKIRVVMTRIKDMTGEYAYNGKPLRIAPEFHRQCQLALYYAMQRRQHDVAVALEKEFPSVKMYFG